MDIGRFSTFVWGGRTWFAVTVAMTCGEMFSYLRGSHFRYDSESARGMSKGGTFDVSRLDSTFKTFTVVNAGEGMVRLYRASDVRELRDGCTW
jgi:hypothetical protein